MDQRPSRRFGAHAIYALLIGLAIAPIAKAQERGFGPPTGFKHLVFASTYRTVDGFGVANDYVALGHYDFVDGQQLDYVYFLYDARRDLKPTASKVRHPAMLPPTTGAQSGPIHLPTYVAEKRFRGTWTMEGDVFRARIGQVVHEWRRRSKSDGLFVMRIPYFNSQDGTNLIEGLTYSNQLGFAYGTDRTVLPQPLSPRQLLPDYDGEIYSLHQPQTGGPRQWSMQATQLHTRWYRSFDNGNVLGYVEMSPQQHPPMAYFSTLLLNYAPHSNLLIYHDGGHDFNRNGVYDEFGHNMQMFGIAEPDGRVNKMVFIEYSFQVNGYPILSVGRYFMKPPIGVKPPPLPPEEAHFQPAPRPATYDAYPGVPRPRADLRPPPAWGRDPAGEVVPAPRP